MKVTNNSVVSIEYELTNNEGTVLDSSKEHEIFSYLHGAGMIIAGLENALSGKSKGDTLSVNLTPEEAYGPVSQDLIQSIPREQFPDVENITVGMQFELQGDTVKHIVTVADISDNEVTIDANHPLAGFALNFAVQIVDIREASESEIANKTVES